MKHPELPISIRAYAKLVNVDEKAVRKAISEGKIKKGVDKQTGKIIPSKADREWGQFHKVVKPQRGVSKVKVAEKLEKQKQNNSAKTTKEIKEVGKKDSKSKDSDKLSDDGEGFTYQELIDAIKLTPYLEYNETLRRKELLNMAAEKMKLEEKEGSLVSRADVDKSLYKLGDIIKKSFLNIPARVIPDLRAAKNDVEATNILTLEIQSVLSSIATMKYVPNASNQ